MEVDSNAGALSIASGGAAYLDYVGTSDALSLSVSAGGNVTFDSDSDGLLTISSASVGANSLDITTAGGVADSASGIIAGTLSVVAGTSSSVVLDKVSHNISNLGAVTADGGFTLDNGDTSLTVTGALSTTDSNVSIDVGTGTYAQNDVDITCLLYTSPSPRDQRGSRMPSSA